MAAAALFLGECLEKTGVAGSLCWCLSGVGTMGVVYSAVLPTFSGDRPSDACPVKEGFLDQIFPEVGVSNHGHRDTDLQGTGEAGSALFLTGRGDGQHPRFPLAPSTYQS